MTKVIKIALFIVSVLAATFISIKGAMILNGGDFEVGDYYFEVDPVITNFLVNPNPALYNSFFPPLMMPLSLEIRTIFSLPFYWLGIINANENPVQSVANFNNRYIIGSLLLLIFSYGALLFSIFKDQIKNLDPKYVLKLFLIVILIAVNPLTFSALNWTHPEEVLLAALIASASLMALKKEYIWAAIFTGLAMATKQPAFFLFPAIFLFIETGQRKRFFLISISTFLIITIPGVIFSFSNFFEHNFLLVGSQDFNTERGFEVFTAFGLRSIAEIGKPFIFLAALLLPLGAALINQDKKSLYLKNLQLSSLQFVLIIPVLFLIRSIFDLGNISYYLLPAGISFILIDYYLQKNYQEKIPSQLRDLPTIPVVATLGSLLLAIIFWRDVLPDLDPMIRGLITMAIILPAIGFMLIKIFPIKKIQSVTKKETAVLVSASLLIILTLGATHQVLNDPEPKLQYNTFKPYSLKRIPLALPSGQSGYWLGKEPVDSLILEKEGMHPKIVFTRYSKKGAITTSFYYGNELTSSDIVVETYNKVPLKINLLIEECLNKNCQGYKILKINNLPILFKAENKDGVSSWQNNNWQALVFIKDQMVKITNNGLAVNLDELVNQLKEIKTAAKD